MLHVLNKLRQKKILFTFYVSFPGKVILTKFTNKIKFYVTKPDMEDNIKDKSKEGGTNLEETKELINNINSLEEKLPAESVQIDNNKEDHLIQNETTDALKDNTVIEISKNIISEVVDDETKIGSSTFQMNVDVEDVLVSEHGTIIENGFFKTGRIIELSRCSWASTDSKQQYVRGCLWSPDGTCVLTAVNNDGMHVIELPLDLYQNNHISPERPLDVLQSAVHIKEGGTVYDYCWYPYMNSTIPETCCWIASRQHEPIHMWDAFNGELRCSYKGYDAVDEVETAIAVAFSSDGERVFGGYKKNLKVFNTDIPGREYDEIPTKQPTSCIAIHETHNDTVAAGSWNCSINLYDLRIPKLGPLATFSQHIGGVTYLKFGRNGDTLFSGARKDDCLFQWDMRNFSKPIMVLNRNVATNQRIYFDLTQDGRWLASGDTTGIIHVWDTNEIFTEYQYALHKDCCNAVGFHQRFPILATTAGQYHFISDDERNEEAVKLYENSLIFWWYGDIDDDGISPSIIHSN